MNFQLYVVGRVACKVVVAAGFVAIASAAKPMREINSKIAAMKLDWEVSKACQSVNDRYMAGKINRAEWLALMHNGPAKMLWVQLSTTYPNHHRYIAKRIREEYPHATRWN